MCVCVDADEKIQSRLKLQKSNSHKFLFVENGDGIFDVLSSLCS